MTEQRPEPMGPGGINSHRADELRRASDRLAVALQGVDLHEQQRLAEEMIEAIQATERAYNLEIEHSRSVEEVPGNG